MGKNTGFPSRHFKILTPFVIMIVAVGLFFVFNPEKKQESILPNTPENIVRDIAKTAGAHPSAQGVFVINHAAIVPHPSLQTLKRRGVHYNISGIKFVDESTQEDSDALIKTIEYLLRTTTKQVLADNNSVSYIAIQILPPHLWAQGFEGYVQKSGYLYIAKRDELIALLEFENENTKWILATQGTTLDLIESNILNKMRESYIGRKREAEREMLER